MPLLSTPVPRTVLPGKVITREELRQRQSDGSVRRAAGFELHARGVDYVLLKDTDGGAKDIAGDPARWGMRRLVYESGASLYEVSPSEVKP